LPCLWQRQAKVLHRSSVRMIDVSKILMFSGVYKFLIN
jgi:hypothetical protein